MFLSPTVVCIRQNCVFAVVTLLGVSSPLDRYTQELSLRGASPEWTTCRKTTQTRQTPLSVSSTQRYRWARGEMTRTHIRQRGLSLLCSCWEGFSAVLLMYSTRGTRLKRSHAAAYAGLMACPMQPSMRRGTSFKTGDKRTTATTQSVPTPYKSTYLAQSYHLTLRTPTTLPHQHTTQHQPYPHPHPTPYRPSPFLPCGCLASAPLCPARKSDIYYRDNIGNFSTSTVSHHLDGVDLSLLSRFPMYGGWKNAWYQGYNMPTEVRVETVYMGQIRNRIFFCFCVLCVIQNVFVYSSFFRPCFVRQCVVLVGLCACV